LTLLRSESDLQGGKDGQINSRLFCLYRQGRHHRYSKGVMKTLDAELAKEAKAIVALAFRNGPIEDVHAGKVCPACNGSSEYSRITEDEMKAMMKSAVNAVYKLLWNRDHDSEAYRRSIEYGVRFTSRWDDPK
jgi:sulfatase maturation enzyme AslB (radical SAM superfamily)